MVDRPSLQPTSSRDRNSYPHPKKPNYTAVPTSSDYIYKHTNGKALAINVTINNVLFLLIVVHGPHTDKEYEIFMDNLVTNIGVPTPNRIPLILGDFNFVEAPALDCVPPVTRQERPLAAAGLTRLLTHIGTHWGGMIDAYRTVWGMQTAVTTHPKTGATRKRLDRIYVPIQFIKDVAPCLRTTQHIPRADLAVTTRTGLQTSYHDAVVATICFTDIQKPPPTWSYKRPFKMEALKEIKAVISKTKQEATHKQASAESTTYYDTES